MNNFGYTLLQIKKRKRLNKMEEALLILATCLVIGLIITVILGTIDHRNIITFGRKGKNIKERILIFRLRREFIFKMKWAGIYRKVDMMMI